jgi:hypothetical protein
MDLEDDQLYGGEDCEEEAEKSEACEDPEVIGGQQEIVLWR